MYIKNQSFKDEDTLHEMLFDFSLGNPSEIIKEHLSAIDKELETNTEYKKYLNSLTDEDDKLATGRGVQPASCRKITGRI